MRSRSAQRAATREHILRAAVAVLVEVGHAGTSTVAVQQRAQVSRGALLHHFPTRADLMSAVVAAIVEVNEAAVRRALHDLDPELDPASRAIRAIHRALCEPAFQAELGLWAAARTDPELRSALHAAERAARPDLRRVVDDAFGPRLVAHPRYRMVSELTLQLLKGISVSRPLGIRDDRIDALLDEWSVLVRETLTP